MKHSCFVGLFLVSLGSPLWAGKFGQVTQTPPAVSEASASPATRLELPPAPDPLPFEDALAPYLAQAIEATDRGSDVPTTLHSVVGSALSGARPWDVRLLGGLQTLSVGTNRVNAGGIAVDVRRPDSPWSVELGGAIAASTPRDFQRIVTTIANASYDVRLTSVSELHGCVTRRLPHGNQRLVVPVLSAGVSLVHVKSAIDRTTTLTYQDSFGPASYSWKEIFEDRREVLAPFVRLGMTFFPESFVSVAVDGAYAGYPVTVAGGGQTFDLGFSGFTIREMVQVRL